MKMKMQDAGCQLGRHELRNSEWLWLEIVKDEREQISAEEDEKARKNSSRQPVAGSR